ncbi:DUF3310 domain-containing protein [Streptomyces sp. NPDC057363]|uniref:DUF3310 domain-containing protein n=1 Tax=Streptomyces sp. NPDC057363 TaxID=3346107 RepID=UPI003627C9C2
MKYKAGDEVRIMWGGKRGKKGRVATVNSSYTAPYPYGVTFSDSDQVCAYNENELAIWEEPTKTEDKVNHPSHYTWLPNGVEVIDLIEHLITNRGNAVKYLCRAGRKNPDTELEDLRKALWYVEREIKRVEKAKSNG